MKRTLALVIALSLLGTIAFLIWPSVLKQHLGDDVFKLTYEFFLTVGIGGALSLVYQVFQDQLQESRKNLQRERDEAARDKEHKTAVREAERALQNLFLSELMQGYSAAKKSDDCSERKPRTQPWSTPNPTITRCRHL